MDVAAAAAAVKLRSTSGVTVLFKTASAASRAGLLAAAVSELSIACGDSGVAMWILVTLPIVIVLRAAMISAMLLVCTVLMNGTAGHAVQSSWFQAIIVDDSAAQISGSSNTDSVLPPSFGLHIVRGRDSLTKVTAPNMFLWCV
jgi:hypothetical protein